MLIKLDDLSNLARAIKDAPSGVVAVDFETTGLKARAGDRAFIVGICWNGDNHSCYLPYELPFERGRTSYIFQQMFSNKNVKFLAHNAKFELTFLRHQFECEVVCPIWDTEVMARLEYNNHMSYSLQNCSLRIGLTKHEPMLRWLKANQKAYHKAPLDLIVPYVEMDARLSYELYLQQHATLTHWNTQSKSPIGELVRLEMRTTKALFELEDAGIDLNTKLCEEAKAYEEQEEKIARQDFNRLTGQDFVSSGKSLQPIFDSHGLTYNYNYDDNGLVSSPSFDDASLELNKDHEIVKSIRKIRSHSKRAGTYWEGLLGASVDGRVYPNIRQSGADTGRFSCSEPNMQNWPDDPDGHLFPIRRAIYCRNPDFTLVSIDYAQMELRMMADEAGETKLIEDIKNGKDFHQELADRASVSRSLAKNGRFAKLYGAGAERVAATIGVERSVAESICKELEKLCPNISRYCRKLIKEYAPYTTNWIGRRFYIESKFKYTAPNKRIQGGCADTMRVALCGIIDLLKPHKSRCILQIHDEFLLRMHKDELHLLPKIKEIMISAHRSMKTLPMDVSMSLGNNYHDMEPYVYSA